MRVYVSPHVLLETAFRRIGHDRGDVRRRQWLGQAIHRRVVDEAKQQRPGYESEVAVRYSFPVDGFEVIFEGRIDGRYVDEAGTCIVEEIKSIHFEEEKDTLIGSPRWERYKLQLGWYLVAISSTEKRPVRGHLVLADVETFASETHIVDINIEEYRLGLVRRIRKLLSEFFEGKALSDAKALEGETLSFPFPAYRPGQREIAGAIERAASTGEHILVEAPTGIGKTAAALLPLLKNALTQGRRLFILTSKTTQQDIYARTLESIEGEAFRTLRLRAKERMCANDVVLCHEDHCPFAREYGMKLAESGLIDRLLVNHRDLVPDVIFEESRLEEVCPFEVSLNLVEEADVVIGDYNYAFDPWISLSEIRDPHELPRTLLLVDEIHNLVDRARGYYSPELSEARLGHLEGLIEESSSPVVPQILRLSQDLRTFIARICDVPEAPEPALVDCQAEDLESFKLLLESIVVKHMSHMKNGGERIPDDPILDMYFEFTRFYDVLQMARPGGFQREEFDVFAEVLPAGRRVAVFCKDPSAKLAPIWDECAAAAGISATLTPPEFYRDLLGFDPDRFTSLRVGSPFPRERRMVRIATDVDTRYSRRKEGIVRIANHLQAFSEGCPGNILVLFPSYSFLEEAARFLDVSPRRRILRPPPRSTELERRRVLSALKDSGPPVTLLTVAGGPFSEGVDYPGRMLLGVAVVSPALPQVKFQQERLRKYFDERFERGFEFAYVIPGMTRVIQSAGRLIRNESDYGTVLLICKRFLQNPYKRHLPPDWFETGPEELLSQNLLEETRQFFEDLEKPHS